MTINEVKQKTGLTKKAINYYEQKGLIKPKYNPANRYRDFSEQDFRRLAVIAFLRQLNISIAKIKPVLENKITVSELLTQELAALDNAIESLKLEKDLVNTCVSKHAFGKVDQIDADKILELKNEIELNQFKRKNYVNSQWQKIFPGRLGRLYALLYNAYLTEPIDSTEKKQAWQAFVDQLDRIEEIEIPPEIDEIINSGFFDKILQATEKTFAPALERIRNLESEQMEAEIPLPPPTPKLSAETVKLLTMMAQLKKFVVEELHIYLTPVNQYLEILSESYVKSKDNLAQMASLMESNKDYKPLLDQYSRIKKAI